MKDSTSLKDLFISFLKDKQQTEEQSGIDESKSSEEILRKNIDKYKRIIEDLQQMKLNSSKVSGETDLTKELQKISCDKGLRILDFEESGNCMFHALSNQLETIKGIEIQHNELRQSLVNYLRENPKLADGGDLYDFIAGYETWHDYLKDMEKDGTWGDHVILYAAANCYATCIRVVSSLPQANDVIITPNCSVGNRKPLVLGHIQESHYVSLPPMQAKDHDIREKTATFEAKHKECIRVLPYTNASGQVYVQLYVFCDKSGIPEELKAAVQEFCDEKGTPEELKVAVQEFCDEKGTPEELKAAAQEFFGEMGVELKYTNLYNYASNKPNIPSGDFKQLDVSKVDAVVKIINKNLSIFSEHRNITAIQPSLKVTNSKKKNEPCIRVYVLGKGRIPVGESKIPDSVGGYPVVIVDGFWLETLDLPKPLTAHKQQKYLRIGASIGVKGTNDAGTLGALVKDEAGKFYLLSCHHVIKDGMRTEITHPAKIHYLTSLKYHLSKYCKWIQRITGHERSFDHEKQQPKYFLTMFRRLQNRVDLFYASLNGDLNERHEKLRECERKLEELFSKPPRTVALAPYGIRNNWDLPDGAKVFIDAAIAELTRDEIKALENIGYVEIIDTGDYPAGDVLSTLEAQNNEREWRKCGCATGYTSLEGSFSFNPIYLRFPEHQRLTLTQLILTDSRVVDPNESIAFHKCLFFENNGNLFSYFGDSGAVIFKKIGQQMSGFGIVIGGIFSGSMCIGTVAVPLSVALEALGSELHKRFSLVSRFQTNPGERH